jgi:hypothetical protein
MSLAPGSFKQAVTMVESPLSGLAEGQDVIYVSTAGDPSTPGTGQIERTPRAIDSTAVVIARGQNVPRSPVVAGGRVYWSTADCAIASIPE